MRCDYRQINFAHGVSESLIAYRSFTKRNYYECVFVGVWPTSTVSVSTLVHFLLIDSAAGGHAGSCRRL